MSITRDQAEVEAERIVRRLIDEVFSEGRLEVADELIADEMIEHQNYGSDHAPGAEGVKAVSVSLRRAFSDFTLTIEDLAVSGDIVWTRNVGAGTNDGSYMGNPPTNRPMRIDVFDVLRVVDGKVVEHWGVPDRLAALQQMGLLDGARSSPAAA